MTLVSVIMPSYNHAEYISEAIESVLKQSYNNLELIIIDDYSRDLSKNIISDYAKLDKRISCIFHKENKGIANTLNDGIDIAKGKFIAFIASDDLWVVNKLEKQLGILKENEDLIVWTEGELIDNNGKSIEKSFTNMHKATNKKKNGKIFSELLTGNYIFASSLILKRDNIKEIRFSERLKYLNDYQFLIDLSKKYEFLFIEESLAKYRVHPNNSISSNKDDWNRDYIILSEYIILEYNDALTKDIKAELLIKIGLSYLCFEDKSKSKLYIYEGIKTNLMNPNNAIYLVRYLVNNHKLVHQVLRRIYRMITQSKLKDKW